MSINQLYLKIYICYIHLIVKDIPGLGLAIIVNGIFDCVVYMIWKVLWKVLAHDSMGKFYKPFF